MRDTISISELEQRRAAMTPGEWSMERHRYETRIRDAFGYIAEMVGASGDQRMANAVGVSAEHNAAPALIAIAKAALEWQRTLGSPMGNSRAHEAECALLSALKAVRE